VEAKFVKDPERYLKGEHWQDEWRSGLGSASGLLPRDSRSDDELAEANAAAIARFQPRGCA
jgi:hypothetical protein